MTSITTTSAETWGRLWSTLADDWAAVEQQQLPTYETAIRHLGIGFDQRVLDVGCGAGVFLRAAADRGARVVASTRLPAFWRSPARGSRRPTCTWATSSRCRSATAASTS